MDIKKIGRKLAGILFRCFRVFPIKKNKIVFCSYSGKGVSDNPKYILEEIINQSLDYDLVWIAKQIRDYDDEFNKIRYVKWNSIRAMYEIATAKIWIDNTRKPEYISKRKSQYYIQTWHGGIALKQIEKDAEDVLDKSYIEAAKNDSKMANLLISNSKFCTNMYRKSFWYEGEILECGSPRNDILITNSEQYKLKICYYYNLDINTKIAIYAPTFRKNNKVDVYDIDYEKCRLALKKKFGGEWIILIRLHPNISEKSNKLEYNQNIINASMYNDMQHLLAASDILITDYSSSMFDFMCTRKPVILYATDIEEYRQERNFYFDLNELPFKIARSNEELEKNIERFNYNEYKESLIRFISKVDIYEDGRSSYNVVKRIKKIINNLEE